jgi:GntR family transcriptional regulator of vanillate catabolism
MDPNKGASDQAGTAATARARATAAPGLVATLRRLIGDGLYPAGARLAEEAVAERLGVSRTPVRLAFRTLAQEGLLAPAGKRGFVVRAFSLADVLAAVEVRGALEGLAARHLAERGVEAALRERLQACLDDGEAVLAKGHLGEADIEAWGALNARFHGALVDAQPTRVIADALARNNHLPFASADSIAVRRDALEREYDKLRVAQLQHRLVVQALLAGEGARVEALMREHANIGVRYGAVFGLDGEAGGA